ncbi:MAG: ATP synthase F0 subunit B [Candidatus Obscuribacterales bacterium]|nr:ATP synthase F0 subunit B [Candidatus Obscuribacterales bacterium]
MFFAEVEAPGIMSIFENNLINWLLLVAFMYWVLAKFLPPAFKSREDGINATLTAAREARSQAEALLSKQKEAVANAEKEADQILDEAKKAAKEMQASIEEQTRKDVADMLAKFENAVAAERQMLVTEMRQASVKAAMQLAREQLASAVTPEVRSQLLNQFMEQLETMNTTKGTMTAGSGASLSATK